MTTTIPDMILTSGGRHATSLAAPNRSDPTRWKAKADAYRAGWKDRIGSEASLANVILGLSVAEHETWCGDAWVGEHNWGACQKRVLTTIERATISAKGIATAPQNVASARAAIDEAITAGTLKPLDHEALHVDSSPGKGWYWVYFWAFLSDAEGASFFVDVLAGKHFAARQVLLTVKAVSPAACWQLAAAMYAAGYYEGFHERNVEYPQKDGSTKLGSELNIADYANSLAMLCPIIAHGLAQGADTEPPSTSPSDLDSVRGYQAALAFLARREGKPELDPGTVDGVAGPKTAAAIRAFQTLVSLPVDGVFGPATRTALRARLG